MIKTTIGHMKSGILIMFEDDDQNTWTRSIQLTWHEAAGLKHELANALDNPSFKERDPKSKSKEVRISG
jgi:hypothetical protein